MFQNFSTKALKYFLIIGFWGSILTISSAQSLPEENSGDVPLLGAGAIIASVGVYDIAVKSQQGNVFGIAFTVLNRKGVQPNVVYAVNLLKKNDQGEMIIVDQKVYDTDILVLGHGESVKKEVVYAAPNFLKGAYILGVQIKNSDGLHFGSAPSQEVILKGGGEGVFIDTPSCFLTIDGKDGKYTLEQGVDISGEEMLIAHCLVENNFTVNTSVTPVFRTHYRSTFGKVIGEEKRGSIALTRGQTFSFLAKIPKVSDPQVYDAVLTFIDNNDKQISSSAIFHYVLRGQSASIQNLVLDKDYYTKGDVAKVTWAWSGSADAFPESRVKPTEIAAGTSLAVSLINNRKEPCTSDFSKPVDVNYGGNTEHLDFPIIADCPNPVATVKIVNPFGKVLAQNSYNIKSKNLPAQNDVLLNLPTGKTSNTSDTLLYIIVSFGILALIVYFVKKRRSLKNGALLGFFVVIGVFFGGGQARADSYPVNVFIHSYGGWEGNYRANFVIDLNKASREYEPGETIIATGAFSAASCDNTMGGKITARINRQTKTVVDGNFVSDPMDGNPTHKRFRITQTANTFTAPTTPGTYRARFTGYYYVVNTGSWIQLYSDPITPSGLQRRRYIGDEWGTVGVAIGTADIIYKVVSTSDSSDTTTPGLSLTIDDPSIITGVTTVLRWTPSGNIDSCSATGDWFGAKSTTTDYEVLGPFGTTTIYTYNLQCTGSDGPTPLRSQILTVTDSLAIVGVCGPANGSPSRMQPAPSSLCSAGTPSEVILNTDRKKWEWSCFGTFGGASVECEADKKPYFKTFTF